MNDLLDLVKQYTQEVITKDNNINIPEGKQEDVINTTAEAFSEGIKNNISLDNLSSITSLFGGGSSNNSNPLIGSLQSGISSALSEKVGLNSGLSTMIASTVVSYAIKAISGKANDANDSFNIESLIGSLTGGNNNKGGGLLDAVKGFFE